MKTARIGAIFLVTIMALAGIGAGYAAWTDTIYIRGTVNTGSVEWHFVGSEYSGTWVFKVYGLNPEIAPPPGSPDKWDKDKEILVYKGRTSVYNEYPGKDAVKAWAEANGGTAELVAYSFAKQDGDNHHAKVVYRNLFPCICFEADVTIKYTGSVPGKINSIGFNYDDDGAYWPEEGDEKLIDHYTTLDVTVNGETVSINNVLGYQLHKGDIIHVVMTIHLPQDNTLMNLNGDFSVYAEVIQWNEYGT